MGLPGVILQLSNGNLGLQPPSAEQSIIYLGCCLGGEINKLAYYGDKSSALQALGGGEALEAAAYALDVSGQIVGVMPLRWGPTTSGISPVQFSGSGTGTLTISAGPVADITMTVVTTGGAGVGQFTTRVGSGAISDVVTMPISTTYQVPGSYTNVTFPGSITAGNVFTFSALGVVTQTGGDSLPTMTNEYVDYYRPTITANTTGIVGVFTFTYDLDGTGNATSAPILSAAQYSIPGTGIILNFGGSTFNVGDHYDFLTAPPVADNTAVTDAYTALETTYLSSPYSMICLVGNLTSASAWSTLATQVIELQSIALFNKGVYSRTFVGCPTVGTVTASGGVVVIDATDDDTALSTARNTTAAAHAPTGAGDVEMSSAITGLSYRRNSVWIQAARAASIEASRNIGDVGLGGVIGVSKLYRDEFATPFLDALGFNTMRTFGNGEPGFFCTDGHTMDLPTSDFYPLTNARVIDRGCSVARRAVIPLVNSKVPTTKRNGLVGVITEQYAKIIDGKVSNALYTAMIYTDPADATAAAVQTSRTHNILADGNLIIAIILQPFGYARTVTVLIGLGIVQ